MAKILVISPTPSHPQNAGNRSRIFSLLSELKSSGHNIYFVFIAFEPGNEGAMKKAWDGFYSLPYQRPTDRWFKQKFDKLAGKVSPHQVFPYRVDDWYTPDLNLQLRKIRDKVQPEVVLIEYIFLSRAFGCFTPGTLKILDTHDIFGNRHKLYIAHGLKPVFFYTTPREEKRALDRADLVLAIQAEESTYFSRLTKRKVITVGHMVHVSVSETTSRREVNRLLFVGSANHINVDGLTWFVETVFPELRKLVPDVQLDVIGQSATKISPRQGIDLLGAVEDLAPYYQRATVVINPLQFGTGLKIKTIEALAYGKPVVTSSVGASGLENAPIEAFLVANTPEQFCESILRLLRSAALRDEVGAKAQDFARCYNRKTVAPFLDLINERYKDHK